MTKSIANSSRSALYRLRDNIEDTIVQYICTFGEKFPSFLLGTLLMLTIILGLRFQVTPQSIITQIEVYGPRRPTIVEVVAEHAILTKTMDTRDLPHV
ncbi:hypothetical protein TNCV_4164911 [Trichonephila clavipes]|nr:hypothetical protein TNCV_4164911 [Trichonephila clavipes]